MADEDLSRAFDAPSPPPLTSALVLEEEPLEPVPPPGIRLDAEQRVAPLKVKRIGFEVLAGALGALAIGLPGAWFGCMAFRGDCARGAL